MEYFEIIVLVVSFLALLIIGVPIAYSIGISVMLTLLVSIPPEAAFTTLAQRIATGLDSFALLAIPFFVLAGQLMNKGGIASRLINFAKGLLGSLPGGLAYVHILASMLFGAISGSAAAAATAVGGIMNKRMVKDGYSKPFSAAINITSATTGLIIPPSNILIVYSLASGGVSIGALFIAGYIPGTLLGLAMMIVAGVVSYKNKYAVGDRTPFKTIIKQFFDALPSLLLLVVVIGGIVAGIFTATEASAIAVLYTLILSMVVYREVKVKDLPEVLIQTVNMTAIIMLLIGTSMGMSWAMSFANIPQQVSASLLALSDNIFVILLIINFILLFVGIFMDMTPAVLIFTPIFLPVVTELGIDPVHFGIVMVMNLCIGLCTPPVGSVLFIGCSVANISIGKVIKPLIPLFIVMILVLLLVTYIPELSLWLPGLFGL